MLNVLVVSMCKPVIHKLKILGVEKLEYYKSMGEPQKEGNQILKFQWVGSKKRGTRFLTRMEWGEYWGKLWNAWNRWRSVHFVLKLQEILGQGYFKQLVFILHNLAKNYLKVLSCVVLISS